MDKIPLTVILGLMEAFLISAQTASKEIIKKVDDSHSPDKNNILTNANIILHASESGLTAIRQMVTSMAETKD